MVNVIAITVLVVILFVVATIGWQVLFAVPFVPTFRGVADAMIDLADIQPGETVVDLGAGDGRLLVRAKERVPLCRPVGYEYVFVVWLLGILKLRITGHRFPFYRSDARYVSLQNADVVFCYLSTHLMRELKKKFEKELKHGARVVSHAFPIPGREPVVTKKMMAPLGKTTVYVYEW